MRRAKLLVAVVGVFALAAAGCNDTPKPTDKSSTPAKTPAENKTKPAEGSGSN